MMTERHEEDVIPKPISIKSAPNSKTKASSIHSQSLGRTSSALGEDEGLEYFYMKHEEEKSRKQKLGFFQRIGLKKKQQKQQQLDEEQQQRIFDELAQDDVEDEIVVIEEEEDEEEDDSSSTISSDSEMMVPSSTSSIYSGKYIKTKTKHKKHNQEFSRLVLAQIIPTRFDSSQDTSSEQQVQVEPGPNYPYGALWVLKFSKDGRYLASAGQSCVIHIWRLVFNQENEGIQVLDETPLKEYKGHTADILDLAWSKNNFLLSSSMDNTVRLWHIEKNVCLCVFRHLNFVTSIQFHPKDDRFFLSGSMDGRIRIWNIPEKSVAFWNEIPGDRFVTAVGFTLDGKMVTAGSHDGHVYFFETQGLKYNTQISVVNDNGRNSSYSKKGPKITGIDVMPGMPPGEEKILVSSNDSKMRLYNMKDKSLMFKYKGVVNSSLQIKANFSDDGQYIISGSEDCHVYIWRTEQASVNPFHHLQEARNKAISALEHVNESAFHINAFQHNNQQPKRIGKWLKKRNKDDDNNHHQGNDNNHNKIRSRTEYFEAHDYIVTSATFAPSKTRQLIAKSKLDTIYNNTPQRRLSSSSSSSSFYYNQENTGHIIATADYRGVIKIWRVDSSSSYTPKKKQQQGETLPLPSDSSSGINSKSAPASPVVRRNFGLFGNRQTK